MAYRNLHRERERKREREESRSSVSVTIAIAISHRFFGFASLLDPKRTISFVDTDTDYLPADNWHLLRHSIGLFYLFFTILDFYFLFPSLEDVGIVCVQISRCLVFEREREGERNNGVIIIEPALADGILIAYFQLPLCCIVRIYHSIVRKDFIFYF